jgi:hypothetical protein
MIVKMQFEYARVTNCFFQTAFRVSLLRLVASVLKDQLILKLWFLPPLVIYL